MTKRVLIPKPELARIIAAAKAEHVTVTIELPDGTKITVAPTRPEPIDPFDQVDMKA